MRKLFFILCIVAAFNGISEDAVRPPKPPADFDNDTPPKSVESVSKVQSQKPSSIEEDEPKPETKKNKSVAPKLVWTDCTKPIFSNGILVEIKKVQLGGMEVYQPSPTAFNPRRTLLTILADPLGIIVELTNSKTGKKMEVTSFADTGIKLTDKSGNDYRALPVNAVRKGQTIFGTQALYPNKTETDILLFEAPVAGFKELYLELPGDAIGSDEPLRFKIPAKQIVDYYHKMK